MLIVLCNAAEVLGVLGLVGGLLGLIALGPRRHEDES
jgi:hypothetical protein